VGVVAGGSGEVAEVGRLVDVVVVVAILGLDVVGLHLEDAVVRLDVEPALQVRDTLELPPGPEPCSMVVWPSNLRMTVAARASM
jgi:hypothetical protein